MTGLVVLIADVGPIDAISGVSGWAGAGLLGLVLAWVFFKHLPAKDLQLDNLLKSHAEQIKEMRKEHVEELSKTRNSHMEQLREQTTKHKQDVADLLANILANAKEQRADFQTALTTVVHHCEREVSALGDGIHKDLAQLGSIVTGLREILQVMRDSLVQQSNSRRGNTSGGKT